MRANEGAEWRARNPRTPAFLALAVAVMAVAGFGFAGVATAVVSLEAHLGPASTGSDLKWSAAEKITPEMSAELHAFGKNSVTKTTSSNWAGYADTVASEYYGNVLEASGEWFVPTISCDVYPALDDQWVGIDGWATGTVEQGGTYGYCNSDGGGPYYWTWFEFYPYENIQSYAEISAGQLVQAYVLYNPSICFGDYCGVYTIVVDDTDDAGASFMIQGNPSTCNSNGCEGGQDSGSECISESLTNQGDYLADYGTETFYRCNTEINGYYNGIGGLPGSAHATVLEITQYGPSTGDLQQKVGSLSSYYQKKDKFTVTWESYD